MSSKMKEGTENRKPEASHAVDALHGEYLAQKGIPRPVLDDACSKDDTKILTAERRLLTQQPSVQADTELWKMRLMCYLMKSTIFSIYLNPSHNKETFAYHLYSWGTNLKEFPYYSQADLSMQIRPDAVLTCSTFLLFWSVFCDVSNQSPASAMQLQPDRVSGTSVYTETKDSIQSLVGYPLIQVKGVFPTAAPTWA